jgi:hypothetical protein
MMMRRPEFLMMRRPEFLMVRRPEKGARKPPTLLLIYLGNSGKWADTDG